MSLSDIPEGCDIAPGTGETHGLCCRGPRPDRSRTSLCIRARRSSRPAEGRLTTTSPALSGEAGTAGVWGSHPRSASRITSRTQWAFSPRPMMKFKNTAFFPKISTAYSRALKTNPRLRPGKTRAKIPGSIVSDPPAPGPVVAVVFTVSARSASSICALPILTSRAFSSGSWNRIPPHPIHNYEVTYTNEQL